MSVVESAAPTGGPEGGPGPSPCVVIVEDHPLAARAVAQALTGAGCRTALWSPDDLRGALAEGRLAADVAVVDLDLGSGGDGATLIGPLSEAGVRVVVCTAETDTARLGACFVHGAVTVVTKSTTADALATAVTEAAAGHSTTPSVRREELVRAARSAQADRQARLAPFRGLTVRESEVLGYLLDGMSPAAIAIYDVVSVKTVRHQIAAILSKLAVRSQLEAVALATRAGWTPPHTV